MTALPCYLFNLHMQVEANGVKGRSTANVDLALWISQETSSSTPLSRMAK